MPNTDGKRAISRRVARRIRQSARARNIEIAELPKLCGVTKERLESVLRGDVSPTLQWLALIARGLGVDVVELVVKR